MMATDSYDDVLIHYGVLGMRWGVRKQDDGSYAKTGSPSDNSSGYDPKNPGQRRQARQEKKAKRYDKRADAAQSEIDRISAKGKSRVPFVTSNRNKRVRDLAKIRDQAHSDAAKKRAGKLSRGEKRWLTAGAVVAAVGTVVATKAYLESGNAKRTIDKAKAFIDKTDPTDFKRNESLADKNLDVEGIQNLVTKHINPDFGDMGTKMNCRRCTFSYELRRRGYDVKATKTTNASGQNTAGLINATSKGMKNLNASLPGVVTQTLKEQIREDSGSNKPTPLRDFLKSSDGSGLGENKISGFSTEGGYQATLFPALAKQPSGSRGELSVQWLAGGGHSVAYEIIKGSPVIFDTQSGETYRTASDFEKLGKKIQSAGFTRLDNKELDLDYLLRWVKNND